MKKIKLGKKKYTIAEIIIIFILMIGIFIYENYFNKIETISPKVEDKIEVTLNRCVDGDTAWFNFNDQKIKTRFLAIDTPETVHPNKNIELYGKDASEFTCKKLTNADHIFLEYEKNTAHYDKYDRHLVWVWVDDKLLQSELVEIGYAKVGYIYAKYTYTDRLYKNEKIAKNNKVGVWTDYQEDNITNNYKITYKYENKKEVTNGKLIDNPIRKGYLFSGWKLNSSLYDFSKPLEKNITLTPSWQKI